MRQDFNYLCLKYKIERGVDLELRYEKSIGKLHKLFIFCFFKGGGGGVRVLRIGRNTPPKNPRRTGMKSRYNMED